MRTSRPERAVVQDVSERLQEFDEIGFLFRGEIQLEVIVVVIDHCEEIGRTPIVEIRRMLPEPSQGRGPVLSRGGSGRIARIRADLRRIMQEWHPASGTAQYVGEVRRLVARSATRFVAEETPAASGRFPIDAAGRGLRRA